MVHGKFHLIGPSYPPPSIGLQSPMVVPNTMHNISLLISWETKGKSVYESHLPWSSKMKHSGEEWCNEIVVCLCSALLLGMSWYITAAEWLVDNALISMDIMMLKSLWIHYRLMQIFVSENCEHIEWMTKIVRLKQTNKTPSPPTTPPKEAKIPKHIGLYVTFISFTS